MLEHRTKLQDGGRLVIPADCRKALNMGPGEEVVVRIENDELLIYPVKQALARARRMVRKHVDKKRSLADELIAERRRESAHE